jgi:hypothetical protein
MTKPIDLSKLGFAPEQQVADWLREHDAPPEIVAAFEAIVGKLPPRRVRPHRPTKAEIEWTLRWVAARLNDKDVVAAATRLALLERRTLRPRVKALVQRMYGITPRQMKEIRHPQRTRVAKRHR